MFMVPLKGLPSSLLTQILGRGPRSAYDLIMLFRVDTVSSKTSNHNRFKAKVTFKKQVAVLNSTIRPWHPQRLPDR
jgi:hypothetical protein